jgi:hypothetical protein
MSIMDDVAALRAMASEVPTAAIRQAMQSLTEMNAKITGLLGEGSPLTPELLLRSNALGIRLESAVAAAVDFENDLHMAAEALANTTGN